MIGQPRGNIAGSADNSRANGIANGDSDAEADAKDLQELSLILARMSVMNGLVAVIRCQRLVGNGQSQE